MTNETQQTNERTLSYEHLLGEHKDAVMAWNAFIDKYKGDFKEQATLKFMSHYRNIFYDGEESGKTRRKLCGKVNSLDWKIYAEHEKSNGELIDLMNDEKYVAELMSLPEIPSTFGYLESLFQTALPIASTLDNISSETHEFFSEREREYPEEIYKGGNLGSKFGEEIIKAYAERIFSDGIYRAQREDANKNKMARIVEETRKKVEKHKEERKASYPNIADSNYWLNHPQEHAIGFGVTHMLNSYIGQVICAKLEGILMKKLKGSN